MPEQLRDPKRLVVIFGPPAVGKMTVGLALASMTGLRLFHNHMTIELLLPIFEHGTPPFNRLVAEFRTRIFEEAAQSTISGLIFTYVWDLGHPGDKVIVDGYADIFHRVGGETCFVELQAPLEVRLERNRTPQRIAHKPSKADHEASEARLLSNEGHTLNTTGDFYYPDRYIKIENGSMSPEEAAAQIKLAFGL